MIIGPETLLINKLVVYKQTFVNSWGDGWGYYNVIPEFENWLDNNTNAIFIKTNTSNIPAIECSSEDYNKIMELINDKSLIKILFG